MHDNDLASVIKNSVDVGHSEPALEDIWERARSLRRMRAAMFLAVPLIAVVAVSLLPNIQSSSDVRPGDVLPAASDPASSPSPSPTTFSPVTYMEQGKEVMPIAFIDGSTGEMLYPPELDLDRMKIQPTGNVSLSRGSGGAVAGPTVFSYWEIPPGDQPVSSERDERGTKRVWDARVVSQSDVHLDLQFGPWRMMIQPNRATFVERARADFAANLQGVETESGFLTLRGGPPIRISSVGDYPAVPELLFGDIMRISPGCIELQWDDSFERNGLTIHRDRDGYDIGRDALAWCDATGTVMVEVEAGALADALIENTSFRHVDLASTP